MRTLFNDYYKATRDTCNTAARWQPCSQDSLFNAWMCAKLKAENYVVMIDAMNLACMADLFQYLPVFSDIYTYCNLGKITSVMIGSVALISALSLF